MPVPHFFVPGEFGVTAYGFFQNIVTTPEILPVASLAYRYVTFAGLRGGMFLMVKPCAGTPRAIIT